MQDNDARSEHTPYTTQQADNIQEGSAGTPAAAESKDAALPIIWTPRFIASFALLLALGLSLSAILTRGWLDRYYASAWVLLAYAGLIFVCWCAVIIYARSSWIRLGGIFGLLWTLLAGLFFILTLFPLDPQATMPGVLNAAAASALLGSNICLATAYTPFRRWDRLFFYLVPLLIVAVVVGDYFLTPAAMRSWGYTGNGVAVALMGLTAAVWWLRPSSWRVQPGPTFLFGVACIIPLFLALPDYATAEHHFFFSQIMLLCLLLGALRILQCELRH